MSRGSLKPLKIPYFSDQLVNVITNHSLIMNLTSGKHLSSRMTRWALEITKYQIITENGAGSNSIVAECLSRTCERQGPEITIPINCSLLTPMVVHSTGALIQLRRDNSELGPV